MFKCNHHRFNDGYKTFAMQPLHLFTRGCMYSETKIFQVTNVHVRIQRALRKGGDFQRGARSMMPKVVHSKQVGPHILIA